MDTSSKEFKAIIQSIQSGRCIIVLGPHAIVDPNNVPLFRHILDHLRKDIKGYNFKNLNETFIDEKYFALEKYREVNMISPPDELHTLYAKYHNKVSPVFEMLAKIPAKLYINTSPDLLLNHAFEKLNIPYQSDYYQRDNELDGSAELDKISKDKPLIYNLGGNYLRQNSMAYNYKKLFNLLFDQSKTFKRFPEPLQQILRSNKNYRYLFLGFDLNGWYWRALFWLLKPHEQEDPSFVFHPKYDEEVPSVEVLEQDSMQLLVLEHDIVETVEKICSGLGPHLREVKEKKTPSLPNHTFPISREKFQDKIEDLTTLLVEKNHGKEVLNEILNVSKGIPEKDTKKGFLNRTNLYLLDWHSIERDKKTRVVSHEDLIIRRNKLSLDILELMQDLEEYHETKV
ncbi:MAG: SIR2 family protein [Bacteroidia bacterium]|nr:SIR2 family protein [Bacteroidia bacterium]